MEREVAKKEPSRGTKECRCASVIGGDMLAPIMCTCSKPVQWVGYEPNHPVCTDCANGKHTP